jgi:hypothetical protein
MPRRFTLTLVAVLAGLALITAAFAQVRFESTRGAFPDDDGPDNVGFDVRIEGDPLLFVLVEEGTGIIPDAITGYAGGDVPEDGMQRVAAVRAMHMCSELVELTGGIVLIHEDLSAREVASAYLTALEGIGITKVEECWTASCHTYGLQMPNQGRMIRLLVSYVPGGVQTYVGR